MPSGCRKSGTPEGAGDRAIAGSESCLVGQACLSGVEFCMFSVFVPSDSSLKKIDTPDLAALPQDAVWIDMVKPTAEEDRAVEGLAGIAVPTRGDMQEIGICGR